MGIAMTLITKKWGEMKGGGKENLGCVRNVRGFGGTEKGYF